MSPRALINAQPSAPLTEHLSGEHLHEFMYQEATGLSRYSEQSKKEEGYRTRYGVWGTALLALTTAVTAPTPVWPAASVITPAATAVITAATIIPTSAV